MVKISCTRRFVSHAASVILLSVGVLPLGRIAEAAKPKPFNPDSAKGTFTGTFASFNGQHTGNLTLKITADKRIRQVPNVGTLAGTAQFTGGKSQKIIGTFIIPIRRVAIALKEKKNSTIHTNFQLDLSQDGTTLTGVYATNVNGDEDGTLTLTRH